MVMRALLRWGDLTDAGGWQLEFYPRRGRMIAYQGHHPKAHLSIARCQYERRGLAIAFHAHHENDPQCIEG
jgi:hypothetical protein